jgi:hypothetical protein
MSNYENCQTIDMTESINKWYRDTITAVLLEIEPLELEGKKIVPKNLKCLQFCQGSAKAAGFYYREALKAKKKFMDH